MKRAKIKTLPSQSRLVSLFEYDAENGSLRWRRKTGLDRSSIGFNNKCAGKSAGTITARGYLTIGIKIDGKLAYYLGQRIIWKMITGRDPGEFVDHKDGDRLNNRWDNLRPATNGQNIQNSKIRRDNKSGVKGVCWDRARHKWVAVITIKKRVIKVGRFRSIEDAKRALAAARIKYHREFARLT